MKFYVYRVFNGEEEVKEFETQKERDQFVEATTEPNDFPEWDIMPASEEERLKIGTIKDLDGNMCDLTWDGVYLWIDDEEEANLETFEDAVEYCAISWQNDIWELQLTEEAAKTLD